MKLIFSAILLMLLLKSNAQDSSKHLLESDTLKTSGVSQMDDVTYTKVEVEAEFPGGKAAWNKFLVKTFRYPEEAQNNEIHGDVVVQFTVDKEGNISNIQAISGPKKGGLREEAVRVISLSGKWVPAMQNGKQVKSIKLVPLSFRIAH
jgi:protein TonB